MSVYRGGASMRRMIGAVAATAMLAVPLAAMAQTAAAAGNAEHGAKLIAAAGCGSCHTIAGIDGADGLVGPPLNNIGARMIIAGVLPNTRPDMIKWLMSPQSVVPGNAMPDMGLNEREAADIAAYLETLR